MTPDFRRLIDFYSRPGARFAFEQLVGELICAEDSAARPIRANPGDYGIDVLSGTSSEALVYQVKYFPDGLGDSQKSQIRDSFQTVSRELGNGLKSWVLVLPVELDLPEDQWFHHWSGTHAVDATWWGPARLAPLLAMNPDLERRYFNHADVDLARRVIEQQDAIIEHLHKSRELANRQPSLTLLLRDGRGATHLEAQIGSLPSNLSIVRARELTEDLVEELVVEFNPPVPVDAIRRVCVDYQEKAKRFNSDASQHALAAVQHELRTYVQFLVRNNGPVSATNVDVEFEVSDGLLMWTDVPPRRGFPPRDPTEPLQQLKADYEAAERSGVTLAFLRAMRDQVKSNLLPPLMRPAAQVEVRRTAVSLDDEGHRGSFWLAKVANAGRSDSPLRGVYVAPVRNGRHQLRYSIRCDEAAQPIEGVLQVNSAGPEQAAAWQHPELLNE